MHEVERLASLVESDADAMAAAAHLAQVVPLIERHVRFRASGSINGFPVEHARVPLGETVVTLYVLRDSMGMPRLACATEDAFWWRRRERDEDEWEENAGLDAETVMALLRRHNVLGAAPEPLAADPASLASELRRIFRVPRADGSLAHFDGERVAEGVSASPGRAAGIARLGAERRDPRDLRAPCLSRPASIRRTRPA